MVGGVHDVAADRVARSVREPGLRPGPRRAGGGESEEARLERERAQRDEDARLQPERDLPRQVLAAVLELRRERPVVRRRALDRGREKRAEELEPVSRPDRLGLIRETRGVERPEEEIAGLVSGEDPAGAVSAVRGRREADDEEPSAGVSERRQRAAPVALATKAARCALDRLLSPGDQSRATPAGNDLPLEPPELGLGPLQRREYFPVSFASARMCPRITASRSRFVAPAGSGTGESSAYSVNT